MNIQFLEKLSNADGIASNEQEVRDVLVAELKEYADEVSTDHLGSIIFKKGNRGPKIMLCAHIDEVGFIVRSVSDMGQVMLMSVGGVKPLAQFIDVYKRQHENRAFYRYVYTGYQRCGFQHCNPAKGAGEKRT